MVVCGGCGKHLEIRTFSGELWTHSTSREPFCLTPPFPTGEGNPSVRKGNDISLGRNNRLCIASFVRIVLTEYRSRNPPATAHGVPQYPHPGAAYRSLQTNSRIYYQPCGSDDVGEDMQSVSLLADLAESRRNNTTVKHLQANSRSCGR